MSPETTVIMNRIIKIQNNHNAIVSAPAATPPKPKIAAMTDIIKKTIAQYNILSSHLSLILN
jgi:hypothetical protein